MARNKPTYVSPQRILELIFLAAFRPGRFTEEEKKDIAVLNAADQSKDPETYDLRSRVQKIRLALAESFLICVSAIFIGWALGIALFAYVGISDSGPVLVTLLGTCILLWATMAILGWDIQSWGGVTLGERLNRWVFRLLYAAGTTLLIAGCCWLLLQ